MHLKKLLPSMIESLQEKEDGVIQPASAIVVCRRGNDSQIVVQHLKNAGISSVQDLVGGFEAWHNQEDPFFLNY